MESLIFNDWDGIVRTLILGFCAYIGLILMLRVSGKRTLSKMNSFDLVVTVALGSTLATILLSKDVALLEGLTALGVLIVLQFLIAWLSVRSPFVRRIVKNEAVLLYHHGRFLEAAMRRERVVPEEVSQALRNNKISSFQDVEAVILETDGSMSILTGEPRAPSTLGEIKNHGE